MFPYLGGRQTEEANFTLEEREKEEMSRIGKGTLVYRGENAAVLFSKRNVVDLTIQYTMFTVA